MFRKMEMFANDYPGHGRAEGTRGGRKGGDALNKGFPLFTEVVCTSMRFLT